MDNGESSCRRFFEGDERAFDEIMKEHFDHVVFFIDRYVHDTYAAEDLAIDVFAEFAAKKRYDGRASLRTYFLIMARSKALNYLKKRASHPMEELDEAQDCADRDLLENEILLSERKRIVNGALDKLPEDQRQAVHLVYFEELSYKEAAKIMKKSGKQVDNLLYRAKNALRTILGEEGRELI